MSPTSHTWSPQKLLHRPSNFHPLLKPLFPSILDSPFHCPQPQPQSSPPAPLSLQKGHPVVGTGRVTSSHKGSVRPGHTGIQTEWNFSIFFTAEKTHTNKSIFITIFLSQVCLEKRREIKLISLPHNRPLCPPPPPPPMPTPCPFHSWPKPGRKTEQTQAPQRTLLPGQCQGLFRGEEETQLQKHTENFPVVF